MYIEPPYYPILYPIVFCHSWVQKLESHQVNVRDKRLHAGDMSFTAKVFINFVYRSAGVRAWIMCRRRLNCFGDFGWTG